MRNSSVLFAPLSTVATRLSLLAYAPAPLTVRGPSAIVRTVASVATHDWLVGLYLAVLFMGVLLGHGPRRDGAIAMMSADTAVFVACIALGRSAITRHRFVIDVLYRVGLVGAVIATFFQLHYILPTITSASYDAQIYQLDLALFGFEPSVAWDRYITPATTEWFSFFYYSYFSIICLFVIPMGLFERRTRIMSEFTLGLLAVVCIGHCLYVLVPGRGPYAYLAPHFEHTLSGGTWWPLVRAAVDSVDGSLRKDIFPSLHTAVPTFLTLFTFRNRAHRPYRYIWPVMAFFTSQIILATMFLRWHYLIDICAGLTLATTVFLLSTRIVKAEARRRSHLGLSPVWTPLITFSKALRSSRDATSTREGRVAPRMPTP